MAPRTVRALGRAALRGVLGAACALLLTGGPAEAQQRDDRVRYRGQDLFLSGGNVAWVRFGRDIGPGETRLDLFEQVFRELRANGGNTFRLWLHTNGASTPEWGGGRVVGPGEGSIEDLRAILDLAARHEVGLILCLWSFDMLRISTGPEVTDRNVQLLTDTATLRSYVNRSLVPMVTALRGHPAIVAWEIFNEPEGMSEEFGWDFNRHVPMAAIQRFINWTAGAIRRTDPSTPVTNGSWSFRAASDVTSGKDLLVAGKRASELSAAEFAAMRAALSARYGYHFSADQARAVYDTLRDWPDNFNYYTDARLVAAGGDPDGVLDFYTVHYYDWAFTLLSPFHHDKDFWGLDKPLVVAEFYMDDAFGVRWQDFYETLHRRGYAGALGWQWYDAFANRPGLTHHWPRILESTRRMQQLRGADVCPSRQDLSQGDDR